MENQQKERPRIWGFVREHGLLSGLVGSLLVAVLTLIAIFHSNSNSDGRRTVGSGAGIANEQTEPTSPETDADEGNEAPTEKTVPTATSLSALAEDREAPGSENAVFEQITVGGIRDPQGVWMQVGSGYDSATLSIPTDREFETIKGRVGITTEPCSSGTVAYVAIRDAEAHVLWPKSGGLEPIHRDAQSFQVPIVGEDEAVLYATAHEAPARCGSGGYEGVNVGWLHTRLLAAE
jgi:hypothetical protein